jgi:glycosyltransferase involved in cell wall biosynthesis
MRVLYLSATGSLGGAERSLLDMLASLRDAEPSWSLRLLAATEGPLLERAQSLGVSTHVEPFGRRLAALGESPVDRTDGPGQLGRLWPAVGPALSYVVRLRRAIRTFAPDIAHTHGVKMHLFGALASPRSTAVVWHLHDYVSRRPLTARLLRMKMRRPAAIVATSHSVAHDARAVFGDRSIVTVHNAVDLGQFSDAGPALDLDAAAGLPPAPVGVLRVGLVATFARWKGHTTFLDALAKLPVDLPVRGYVVGGALYQTEGSQHSRDELQRAAAERGVGERVGFTGFVEHPERAMRSLDIVVHASTVPEPFGLVIAEAMACGRPVIASDAGGARELFADGREGLRHTPGSSDSLAAAIAVLARDPDLRARLGRAARTAAQAHFDRARLASDLRPVYRRAVAA